MNSKFLVASVFLVLISTMAFAEIGEVAPVFEFANRFAIERLGNHSPAQKTFSLLALTPGLAPVPPQPPTPAPVPPQPPMPAPVPPQPPIPFPSYEDINRVRQIGAEQARMFANRVVHIYGQAEN